MKQQTSFPQTLAQAIKHFADLNNCIDFLANLRWPDGVTCPACGGKEVSYVSTRRIWKCKQEHDHRHEWQLLVHRYPCGHVSDVVGELSGSELCQCQQHCGHRRRHDGAELLTHRCAGQRLLHRHDAN